MSLGRVIWLMAVVAALQPGPARADDVSIEGNVLFPDQSLKAHQPGPGVTVTWEHPVSSRWSAEGSTGYLTLLSKKVPSFQMIPLQVGASYAILGGTATPYVAGNLGLFITSESFRFLFDGESITDDDWTLYWGPGVGAGYRWSWFDSSLSYQVLWPASAGAGFFRLQAGYRF
jgi:hypothetical protein